MNAFQNNDEHNEFVPENEVLEKVLDGLYSVAKNADADGLQEMVLTIETHNSKDYLEARAFLKENKIIKKTKNYFLIEKEEKIEIAENVYEATEMVCYTQEAYIFKPSAVIKFYIDTSRIAKYTLALDKKRRLILNGNKIIATLQYNSPNLSFFKCMFGNLGNTIKKDNLLNDDGLKITKRFHTILEQVIKNSELRRVFFPSVAKDLAEFRNNVKRIDILDEEIDERKIDIYVKSLKKYKEISNI